MRSHEKCPPHFEAAMGVLGKKWTAMILGALMEGPRRFTEISAYVPSVSDRLLSQRLQELEEEEIVTREVYSDRPVRIEYSLTDKGRDLRTVIRAIHTWGERWQMVEAPSS